jgi:hypothetical protein
MSTWNGIGTKYLGFGFMQPDGSHNATRWFVVVDMPILPLGRYRLRVGDTAFTQDGYRNITTTQYRVLGSTRIHLLEVLATYLTWWIIAPGIVIAPIGLMISLDNSSDFGDTVTAIGAIVWLVGSMIALTTGTKRVRRLP